MNHLYLTALRLSILPILLFVLSVSCKEPTATRSYTVAFETNEGTTVKNQTVKEGKKASQPDNPTREGYAFGGWYRDKALTQSFDFNTTIIANITLYAKWDKTVFTVAFQSNGGSPVASITIAKGTTIKKPDNPTKKDSIFDAWYTDNTFQKYFEFANTPITANITLYAKWVQSVTVTFQANGGSTVDPITVATNSKIKKPDNPTKQDSIFGAWYTGNTLQKSFEFANTPITADITLYAKWNPITYTVSFQTNEGSPIPPKTTTKGNTITQPDIPTKKDSIFDAWYTDNTFRKSFNFNTAITTDITLYAKWNPIIHTVTFQTNGGAPVASITIAKGNTIQKPTPTKGKSTLLSWYKDNALTQSFDFSTAITADITLYAKYGFRIPDGNFRNKLKTLISAAFIGEVIDTAHSDVTRLNSMSVPDAGIKSLAGIEYFTALTQLNCYNNQLASLDVATNTNLTQLNCYNNQLASLDVATNTNLTQLNCYNNQLTSLNLATNTALTSLDCNTNQLITLDVATNTKLTSLSCYVNKLTSLDVATNTKLTRLYCNTNQLITLDVATNTKLRTLSCYTNQLTTLDVATNTALTSLSCSTNQLTSLNLATNTALTSLDCYNNQLTTLDVATNTQLTSLACSNNQLTSLNMRGIGTGLLTRLEINAGEGGKNPLTSLHVLDVLKDHAEIKEAKTNRGEAVTITTYNNDRTTVICNNYDPNQGTCLDP